VLAIALGIACGPRQQVVDAEYVPHVERPEFALGAGPLVLIDAAHHNFHTVDGRYHHFAELLRLDGYRVEGTDVLFTPQALQDIEVLVISNALHASNSQEWALPTPSAFTATEIDALEAWVSEGGSLLLIADHMPFPGAAADLAAVFGLRFLNGFALNERDEGERADTRAAVRTPTVFERDSGSLADHVITAGRRPEEKIDRVATFTGQAFRLEGAGAPLLKFPSGFVSVQPTRAWEFTESQERQDLDGWLQGAAVVHGRGRVAVFGEAAMFTAQRASTSHEPMGLNAPIAAQNAQFVLNVLHWLSGEL
jgi:hypothetical protein